MKAGIKPNRTIRKAATLWQSNGTELGTIETNEITFFYFSPTIAEMKAARDEIEQKFKENPDEIFWISETLIKSIHSIPDLKVGEGQPSALTLEWFEAQDLKNLTALKEAMENDLNPKS